jgi:hypothetical protein
MKDIRIQPTDRFFYDSPDTGEIGCVCSRCHNHIKEGERILRHAVDSKDFTVRDKETLMPVTEEMPGGFEFRLCGECIDKAFANDRW